MEDSTNDPKKDIRRARIIIGVPKAQADHLRKQLAEMAKKKAGSPDSGQVKDECD